MKILKSLKRKKMIRSIELNNFLSHSFTKLNFDSGVTIFIGHNGAGKSSIIDAITFVLFGKHMRNSNKSLIKRGTNMAYVKIIFTMNNRNYEAIRKIDTNGNLYAQLTEIRSKDSIILVSGERKQFGESMTKQIEGIIGIDFHKLKIASIVQQGELNSIIKSKPREFKEIINAIIGIDKLDTASELMKIIKKNFRELIQKRTGYDDTHINTLSKKIQIDKNEIKKSKPLKQSLILRKQTCKKEIDNLQKKIEDEIHKEIKTNEIENRKHELVDYVNTLATSINNNIIQSDYKIKICEECFEYMNSRNEIETNYQKINTVLEKTSQKIQYYNARENVLRDHMELAKRLKLKNNVCPVCNSKIEKLSPLFQEEYIRYEMHVLKNKIDGTEKEKEQYDKIKNKFETKLQKIVNSEITLSTYSIKDHDELNKIKHDNIIQKNNLEKISVAINSRSLVEIASIDLHAKNLYNKIVSLKKEVLYFDSAKFTALKLEVENKRKRLSSMDQELGAVTEKINIINNTICDMEHILHEVTLAKEYILLLNMIHDNIFNRDGPVATSLRSWALETISVKASEYLTLLNINVHRIVISEKIRGMSIVCYSKNTALEIDSLSGGEQVCVSIALRLGIMHMLGISNLKCIILDEPTINLDDERRKSLVNIFSQLSYIASNFRSLMQLIIITHDSEIFENSNVDRIYKFSSDFNNSKVASL